MEGVKGGVDSFEGGGGPVGLDLTKPTQQSISVVTVWCEMTSSEKVYGLAALKAGTACFPRAAARW